MAYEYEKFILSLLTSLAIKKQNKGYYTIADEVEEVYAKAKAFDEILNIDLDQHEIIVHGQVEDIVNKYMEDK
ncbi:hypothetical protein [Mammaliicoccus sciuri]|uniref:hypothetical protein n=1 Tax=Mammaliicoccus sciuri TaxID=1296 RepID=UPI002DB97F58|nr:hypothetical protein [Mammaliicoccus sciuri]MEB6263633.1 isopentenyl transferase family protein [Mammaliicoccus sciuri]